MDQLDTKLDTQRQECEVYSRCCGYLRPTKQWNDAKQAEWGERKVFEVKE